MFEKIRAKLRREHVDDKKFVLDVLILFVVSGLTIFLFHLFGISELFYNFTRKYERFELDEIIFSLAVISIYFMLFSVKRYFDLRDYIVRANIDGLIGIFNRRKGTEIIKDEMDYAIKKGKNISLIMYDLDNFKIINDSLGHNVGDTVLKKVVDLVESEIRIGDVHIRWGGEEFIILCPDTDIERATIIAERCRKKIERAVIMPNNNITASFGVMEADIQEDLRSNIEKLDTLLYKSKISGRNRVTGVSV